MAGAINPFFNVSRSTPISQFVDQSMPAELMLQAGLAKQGQYDKMLTLQNTLAAFDQAAIPNSPDEKYVRALQEEINSLVDSNIGKDLANSQVNQELFKYARKIQQDPTLKRVTSNYGKYQQLLEDYKDLYKKQELFDPSANRAFRRLQEYSSGTEVGDVGDLLVAKSLNLFDKEKGYFEPMKANSGEDFEQDFNRFQGLYFKTGTKGISEDRIGRQIYMALPDYKASSEGKQAMEIYQDMIERGQPPLDIAGRPITNVDRYLFDRLARTGNTFVYGELSKDYNAGLNDRLFPKEAESEKPVRGPGATLNLGNLSRAERTAIKNDPNAPEAQKQAINSVLDKARKTVDETNKGQQLTEKINTTAELAANFDATKFKSFADPVKYRFSDKENGVKTVAKLAELLSEKLPDIITEKAKEKDMEFFKSLTRKDGKEDSLLELDTTDKENPYITIHGTGTKISLEELGIATENIQTINHTILPELSEAISLTYQGAGLKHLVKDDPITKLYDNLKEYDDLVDEQASGTVTQVSSNLRTVAPTAKTAVEETFRSANFSNLTAVNTGDLSEVLDGKTLESLVANISSGDVSVRAEEGTRMLEVTIGKGEEAKTFKVQEKPGLEGTDETFDRIYELVTKDPQAGQKAGAVGKFSTNITSDFKPLSKLTEGFTGVLPTTVDPSINVKMAPANSELPGKYIIGDKDGTITMRDLVDRMYEGNDQDSRNVAANKFIELAAAKKLSREKITALLTMLEDSSITQGEYSTEDMALFTNLMNEDLFANDYNEVLALSALLSY